MAQDLKNKLKRLYRPERYTLESMGQVMKRGDGKGQWLPGLYRRTNQPKGKYIINLPLSLALDILNGYVQPQRKYLTSNCKEIFDEWNR